MKAIAVTSGGMDSVSMALALLVQDYEVKMLHFDYGQKCEEGELRAVATMCDRLTGEYPVTGRVVYVEPAFRAIANASSLTSDEREILPGMESLVASRESAGADLWVPGRNLVFLSIAAAHAEAWGAEVISWGANQSETSYPDNTREFADRMSAVIEYGCRKPVRIVAPLYDMDKVEILRWGHEHGFGWVYDHTWSCDAAPDARGRPCGVCGCCCNRRLAHHFSGLGDQQEYVDPDYFELVFLPEALGRDDLWYAKYLP